MKNKSVCILNYGSGNVKSVFNMLSFLGYDAKVSNSKEDIINSSHVILPGVGAFGASMKKIIRQIPFDVLENEVVDKGKPFLGICVGMECKSLQIKVWSLVNMMVLDGYPVL